MDENQKKRDLLNIEIIGILKKKQTKININTQANRNYGIDLLKIVSMVNIINLHINLHTPHLKLNPLHPKYKQVYRLEAFSYWPVDAFGLISGIIGYRKYKFANIIYLWLEYFFYSVIFSVYLYHKSLISQKILFYHFLPLGIRRHWYVNAYIFMYLFLPFITNSLNSMNKALYSKIILCFFFIYSFYHIIIILIIQSTNFNFINSGYSTLWLLILYIIGAYFGRFYINKPLFSSIFFLFIYLIASLLSSEYIFYSFRKNKIPNKIFLQYFSPTIIIQAISLIFFFSNLKLRNKYLIKVITFFNPLNFNVTLIHSRIFYFQTPTVLKFYEFIKSLTPKFLFFKIYGLSTLIYFASAFFDYFRFLLFKVLRIRYLCYYIEKKVI